MLDKYILDDSIKSPTLILTADHLTLLFLPGFFLPKKELTFSSVGESLHDHGLVFAWPSPFNGPFFMTLPFSESQKVVTLPLFPRPFPPANFWQVPKIENGELCQNIDIQILLISHFLLYLYL